MDLEQHQTNSTRGFHGIRVVNIFFVTGNLEYYIKNSKTKIEEINNIGIKHLSNTNLEINNVNLIGVDDNLTKEQQIEIVRNKHSISKFNITLIHKPSVWDKVQNYDYWEHFQKHQRKVR